MHQGQSEAALDYLRQQQDEQQRGLGDLGPDLWLALRRRCSPPPTRASKKADTDIIDVFYSMTPIFELAPPSYKSTFMRIAGIIDEAAFDGWRRQWASPASAPSSPVPRARRAGP